MAEPDLEIRKPGFSFGTFGPSLVGGLRVGGYTYAVIWSRER
jgi:hypothetical protein